VEVLCFLPSTHYPLYDFDLRATQARTLLPAALASVSFGFVLVRVRIRSAAAAKSPCHPLAGIIHVPLNRFKSRTAGSSVNSPSGFV